MGFGSYDESEQENQEIDVENADTGEGIPEEADNNGEVEFEFTTSTDELVGKLDEMK